METALDLVAQPLASVNGHKKGAENRCPEKGEQGVNKADTKAAT
jgi:hypothetical protein